MRRRGTTLEFSAFAGIDTLAINAPDNYSLNRAPALSYATQ